MELQDPEGETTMLSCNVGNQVPCHIPEEYNPPATPLQKTLPCIIQPLLQSNQCTCKIITS